MKIGNAAIKMESRIRICIGIKTMPIHNSTTTVFMSESEASFSRKCKLQSQSESTLYINQQSS